MQCSNRIRGQVRQHQYQRMAAFKDALPLLPDVNSEKRPMADVFNPMPLVLVHTTGLFAMSARTSKLRMRGSMWVK